MKLYVMREDDPRVKTGYNGCHQNFSIVPIVRATTDEEAIAIVKAAYAAVGETVEVECLPYETQ